MRYEKVLSGERCPGCGYTKGRSKNGHNPLQYGIENGRIVEWNCPDCGWVYRPESTVPAANNRRFMTPPIEDPEHPWRKTKATV